MATATDAEQKLIKHRLGQIGRDTGIVFLGNVLDKLFGFAFTIGIAKLYGLRMFGLFLLGLTICQAGALVFNLGFGNGLIRYVSLYKKDKEKLRGTIWTAGVLSVSLAALLGLVLFLVADPMARHFFANKGRLAFILQCFAFTLPLSAASGIWVRTLVGLRNFKVQAYVRNLIEPGVKVGGALVFFALGFKLEGLILAYVLSTVVASGAAYYFYSAALRERLRGVRPVLQFKEFIGYCWPLVMRNLVSKVSRRADVLLLGAFRSPVEITLYMFALRLASFHSFITDAFDRAYSPHIPGLHADGKHQELGHAFQTVARWTMLLTVPIFIMLIVFPEAIIPVLGEQFMPAATAVSLVTGAACFSYAVGPSETAIVMAGRSKVSLVIRMVGGVVALGLNVWLIPRYGIIGAAVGFMMTAVVTSLLAGGMAYRDMRLHPFQWGYLKILLAGMIAVGVGAVLQPVLPANKYVSLLLLGASLLLIYGSSLLLLGLDDEDKEMFGRLWTWVQSAFSGRAAPRLADVGTKSD